MPCECAPWYAGGTSRTCDACKVEQAERERDEWDSKCQAMQVAIRNIRETLAKVEAERDYLRQRVRDEERRASEVEHYLTRIGKERHALLERIATLEQRLVEEVAMRDEARALLQGEKENAAAFQAHAAQLAALLEQAEQERDALREALTAERDAALAAERWWQTADATGGWIDDLRNAKEQAERIAAALREALERAYQEFRSFHENWDCDTDAHTYGTSCRACDAEAAMGAIRTALAPTKEEA